MILYLNVAVTIGLIAILGLLWHGVIVLEHIYSALVYLNKKTDKLNEKDASGEKDNN